MSEPAGRPARATPGAGAAIGTPDASGAAAARAQRRVAWLVALLLGFGCVAATASLIAQARHGTTFDAQGWRDGSLGRALDRAIDVPYAHTLQRWQAAARYRLFGDLGPQVREGCPGWLFYADGLRAPVQPGREPVERADGGDTTLDARIAALRGYADALRDTGIRLVVVTVPDKARVESDALCGLHQDARMTQRRMAWDRALGAQRVVHVDLLPALQAVRPAFFRTDVHWNARGAQVAAQQVGATVLPLLGARGDAHFTHTTAPVGQRIGDLLTLANLNDVSDAWRPAPDVVAEETLHAQRSGGLLDDGPAADVMLAGSSFSRRSAFAERLGEQLGREVWNVSLDDGQFDRALQAMWRERASWPRSVRVVIWEISEDALSMPPETKTAAPVAPGLPLPAGSGSGSVTPAPTAAATPTQTGALAQVRVQMRVQAPAPHTLRQQG